MTVSSWSRRHWIPPGALLFALLSHGASWLLLAYAAARAEEASFNPAVAAWVHLVALGWFSMAALGILIHVIPTFTDLTWALESMARWSLVAFGAGVAFFVGSWLVLPVAIPFGALLIGLAFAAYLAAASLTLWGAPQTERAIPRALAITLWTFFAVAVLGILMALAMTGAAPSAWLTRMPQAHANLGFYGWLTILVFGVSARTMGPICGARSRWRWIHAGVGTCVFAGTLALAIGLGVAASPLALAGGVLVTIGVAFYVVDIADILKRASVPHRPPQAFVAAAIVWLVASLVAGAGALFGESWQAPYVFLILVGWVGQMVNAHMFHIGVRLIATFHRGDDDETRPAELLDVRLSWFTFGAFQAAIVLCAAGLWGLGSAYVLAGALLGLAGWCALIANLNGARRRAQQPPRVYDPIGAHQHSA